MKSHNYKSADRCGFTIVELLVVVSVPVLLISLLLPSLQRAMDLAQINVCLGNLRQICIGEKGYENDNKQLGPVYTNAPYADNTVFQPFIPTTAAYGAMRSGLGIIYDSDYWTTSKLAYCPTETSWAWSKGWATNGSAWWSSVNNRQNQIEWNDPRLAGQRLNSSYMYRWACPNPHTALDATLVPNLQSYDGQLFAMKFTISSTYRLQDIGMCADQTMDWGLSPATASGTAHPGGGNCVYFDGHAKFLSSLVNPYNPGNGPYGYYLGYLVYATMIDGK